LIATISAIALISFIANPYNGASFAFIYSATFYYWHDSNPSHHIPRQQIRQPLSKDIVTKTSIPSELIVQFVKIRENLLSISLALTKNSFAQ